LISLDNTGIMSSKQIMEELIPTIPLIRTKLHRPPVTADHMHRPQLLERLERNLQRPLSLISAPAGYGKSTLVSCWLDASDIPGAWVSLDENDNDLRMFLAYLTASVQTIFPAAVRETRAMLNGAALPPVTVLARSLINELDQIDKTFILVLDDYHFIGEKAVHGLIYELLNNPPAMMHLVLATRRDPPLPLSTLRAKSRMAEIRVQELRFSSAETAEFLQRVLKTPVDETTAAVMEERTEGWVTGLRLAALSLRDRLDMDRILTDLPEDNRYVMDYIVREIISQQSPDMQEFLLTTSILERFCAPLCDAICPPGAEPGTCVITGQEFLKSLEQSNLFVVPLDDQDRWFRYHHLFQQLLKRQLKRRFSSEYIEAIHKRASTWCTENGLIEEALHHALEGGDSAGAVQIVAQHRHELMNQEQWHRLPRLLSLISHDTFENNPDLLMVESWTLWNQMRLTEMGDVLDLIEPLLAAMPTGSTTAKELQGELDALRSVQYFLGAPCDGPRALAHAQQAIQRIPRQRHSQRGFAIIILAMSYQMAGDLESAYSVVFDAMSEKEAHRTTFHTRLLITLGFIYWVEADLIKLQQTADQQLKLGQEFNLPESIGIARYFLGISHYCHNELTSAERKLAVVVKDINIGNIFNFAHSAFTLALTYQAQGRTSEALDLTELVVSHSLGTNNAPLLQMAHAFQAELALRQGNMAEASHWMKTYEPEPFRAAHRFYVPQLTLAKVLLAQGTIESQRKVADLLAGLHDFFTSIHNTRFLIDVLALQALLYDARGDEAEALSVLEYAIKLARPGGFIRPFLDLGPKMAGLLNRLAKQNIAVKYIGQILAAFSNDGIGAVPDTSEDQIIHPSAVSPQPWDEALTNREIEILALLAQRLRNKEIAEKLFISPETVKRHTINIYQKLNVNKRQQAVAKAYRLGVLSQR
jgi:LuxR family maltose regulon positive regulatory protein